MRWALRFVVALVMALAVVPASALAAPANDKFENREALGPGFPGSEPIEVNASNVEATHEEGENSPIFAAGHSVWYEWEAESNGWTTIGACEANFPTIIGVFTGELGALTPVASGNGSEGPYCVGGQRQFTFNAQAGTKYEISVDGNGLYVEPPPPVTEGEFTLLIEKTPPPPNDKFEFADQFEGSIGEEPGGARYYFAHAQGYNWGATTEGPEEPLDSPSDGATVWYRWTAPATATYQFSGPCCGSGLNWDLYTGSSLEALTENLAATGPAEVSATAGTVYRIAVYGTPQSEGGEPTMASFQFTISANLPPLPQPPPSTGSSAPPPDTTPPQTTIARTKILSATGAVKFWFASSEGGSFLCRLDKKPFRPCSSPVAYRHLKPGRHTFRAEAVDAAGNVDPTPAVARIKIPHKQSHRLR